MKQAWLCNAQHYADSGSDADDNFSEPLKCNKCLDIEP